jgi:uncharacterized membrane protein YeaQ/YmgE (transglycosylase-associated protein family)
MNILEWIILLVVAGVCGAIGAAIVGRSFSFLVLIAIGFIGAMLGRWISGQTGIGEAFALKIGTQSIPILWTIVGSMVLVGIASLFVRARYTRV